jgi:hypothetical protein
MEQRRTPRQHVELPLRILELDGQPVNWAGQTRDISLGGVSFSIESQLTAGKAITYVVTLSSSAPPVQIRCLGKVLRCRKTDSAPAKSLCEVAVGMERYTFIRREEVEPELVAV